MAEQTGVQCDLKTPAVEIRELEKEEVAQFRGCGRSETVLRVALMEVQVGFTVYRLKRVSG